MGGRALIVTLLGIMFLSASVFYSITRSSQDLMKNVDKYYLQQSAYNLAQSGVNLALRQLVNNSSWRTGFANMSSMGGRIHVRLVDTTYQSQPVLKIVSTGISDYGKGTERRATSSAYITSGFVPATLKAAITTNNPIKTLGGLVVDGRDHAMDGTLRSNAGTLGIWTTRTLNQSGNSKIGGTNGGIDYVPSKPGDSHIIATSQSWPGGYPTSPDSILGGTSNGYPEGKLKALAMSGTGGGQYVTDPNLLTLPLGGVTYVELPSGGVWQSMDLTGSGILVVHNQYKNAALKNLNSGTFAGLMIVDDIVHIHTTIIGGLIGLSPNPSQGNCIGNGNGRVLYSEEAIVRATGSAGGSAGSVGGSSSRVIAWWE